MARRRRGKVSSIITDLKQEATISKLIEYPVYLHNSDSFFNVGLGEVRSRIIQYAEQAFFNQVRNRIKNIGLSLKLAEEKLFKEISFKTGMPIKTLEDFNDQYSLFTKNNAQKEFLNYLCTLEEYKIEETFAWEESLNKNLKWIPWNKQKDLNELKKNIRASLAKQTGLLDLYNEGLSSKGAERKEIAEKLRGQIDTFNDLNNDQKIALKKVFLSGKKGLGRIVSGVSNIKSRDLGFVSEAIWDTKLTEFMVNLAKSAVSLPNQKRLQQDQSTKTIDWLSEILNKTYTLSVSMKTSAKIVVDNEIKKVVDSFTGGRGQNTKDYDFSNNSVTEQMFTNDEAWKAVQYAVLNAKIADNKENILYLSETLKAIKNIIGWSLVVTSVLGTSIGIGPKYDTNINLTDPKIISQNFPLLLLGIHGFHSTGDFLLSLSKENFYWIEEQFSSFARVDNIWSSSSIDKKSLYSSKRNYLMSSKDDRNYVDLKNSILNDLRELNTTLLKDTKYSVNYKIALGNAINLK